MEVGNINNKYINPFMEKTMQTTDDITGESFETSLRSAMEKKDDKELRKVCQQFESIMLGMVYKQMKATVPKSDFLKDDSSIEILQSMLDDELVAEASKNSNFGIADAMYKQLYRQLNITQKDTDSSSENMPDKAAENKDKVE